MEAYGVQNFDLWNSSECVSDKGGYDIQNFLFVEMEKWGGK